MTVDATSELKAASSSDSWEERYRALERARELPAGQRHEVATAFLEDSNPWVSSLARQLSAQTRRVSRRSRRGIVMDIDRVLHGAKLSTAKRAELIELYSDAEQMGSLGFLSLATDRASRLVSESLSSDEHARTLALENLQRFVRHVAQFARPPRVDASDICDVSETVERAAELVSQESIQGVRVNKQAIETALEEVRLNATEAGAGRVRVRVTTAGERVLLHIENNGPSLGDRELTGLFVPWFTTKSGHAGLGLAIAHAVLEQVGGSIRLESPEPVRFIVELPRER